jgi:hypothetical protein
MLRKTEREERWIMTFTGIQTFLQTIIKQLMFVANILLIGVCLPMIVIHLLPKDDELSEDEEQPQDEELPEDEEQPQVDELSKDGELPIDSWIMNFILVIISILLGIILVFFVRHFVGG